jgi:pyridoxal biosynthesis lyase PdxS
MLLEASEELGEPMRGLDVSRLAKEELLQTRGW